MTWLVAIVDGVAVPMLDDSLHRIACENNNWEIRLERKSLEDCLLYQLGFNAHKY